MESLYSIALKIHLAIFLLLNLILFLIDFVTGGGWWFYWITAVWLVALLFQAFAGYKTASRGKSEGDISLTKGNEIDDDFWKLE
jgi:hypothetical protein